MYYLISVYYLFCLRVLYFYITSSDLHYDSSMTVFLLSLYIDIYLNLLNKYNTKHLTRILYIKGKNYFSVNT